MAESEDEIDYMSADFLSQCVGNDDVRPGLIYSHSAKRKVEMDKRKRERDAKHKATFKPVKEVQKERLEEGLSTALNSSNKGFAMLQKMGYKPGTSLGKGDQGRLEPVSVDLKQDRVGLGWQQMVSDYKKKRQERKLKKQMQKNTVDPEEYRARMRSQRQEKFLQRDLMRSQRVCYEMDSKENITEPEETWFWPRYTQEREEEEEYDEEEEEEDEDEEEEEEDEWEFDPLEQLNILTAYLRSQYMYCLWCGTVFDDERDLKQNCPGSTRDDHDDE